MPIGFSTVTSLPVPASYRRDGLDERRQQREQTNIIQQQQSQQQTAGDITRIRTRASVAAQRAGSQAQSFQALDNLSARARSAVTAYSNNGPSVEERLGVELAGVDVYA